MRAAHDIHAEINPAYCAMVLAHFCEAYRQHQVQGYGPAAAVAYLVLPLVLSEDLAVAFDGCNKNTGLLVWLDRSPRVLMELSQRVNTTLTVSTEAIRFGCIAGMLRLSHLGEIESLDRKVPAAVSGGIAAGALKRARLLGIWFAGAGSARAVMEALGVSL
ncbi:three component ABC system middle component [Pseudomonas nitroreducens]|uniref:Uncharacterized protein n=1 Tax=Pseudomonas nitroreducens TaxID=46680 RepID=A0A6G6J3W3_PSENT|nr:three component ABC system middle component [Pseudomonas nitroreducens]QIE89750.1 hypothetical protein G5B91_27205 [Pseudomonas nitroreducens]